MRYRVDELAVRSGVSVDTIRFYQGKGLLGRPERDGRVAWYSDAHLEVLRRIRDLKEQGFSLASIRRMLAGELDPVDEALVSALARPPLAGRGGGNEWLALEDLAERTGVTPALLDALGREGLLVPRMRDGTPMYSAADERAIAAGLRLLEAGLPLSDLLDLARAHTDAMRDIAARAVDLFDAHVRHPLLERKHEADVSRALAEAFEDLFPATTELVAHHFGRLLIEAALERVEGARRAAGPSDPVMGSP